MNQSSGKALCKLSGQFLNEEEPGCRQTGSPSNTTSAHTARSMGHQAHHGHPNIACGSPTTASGPAADEPVTSGSGTVIRVLYVLLGVTCHLSSSEPGSYDFEKPRPAQVMTVSEEQEKGNSGLWGLRTRPRASSCCILAPFLGEAANSADSLPQCLVPSDWFCTVQRPSYPPSTDTPLFSPYFLE